MRAFNLTTGMHKLQLSEPVRITKVPERVEIQPLTLALDDGTMKVALRQTAGEMNLDLKLESIPLGLADLADIPLGVGGRLSGTVDFSAQGQIGRAHV